MQSAARKKESIDHDIGLAVSLTRVEGKIDTLAGDLGEIKVTTGALDERMSGVEERLGGVEDRLDRIEKQLTELLRLAKRGK